jgi:hypothetical protein
MTEVEGRNILVPVDDAEVNAFRSRLLLSSSIFIDGHSAHHEHEINDS